MFFVFLILWFIFNERVTVELAVIGLLASALVEMFVWKILGKPVRRKLKTRLRLIAESISYGGNLLKEIVKCTFGVIRLILSPSLEVEPELHYFSTKLKSDTARVALANSITLTPGTMTCTLEEDVLCVHALDASMAEGIEESDFEKRLLKLEDIADES